MITFTKIRYKNFLSSGNVFTEMDLNTHKNTLIMGHNGSGKSTLLDALTFSLFGKPFRKVNKGNVVNSINNKQCQVEIEFNIGNKFYKVIRGIKPNVFEIWLDGVMLNQDASSRDYQEFLEKNILKMNFKTFTQVVILGSASFIPFMQLSAADRRLVIENLLDIQIFSAMSTVVKTKLQLNKDKLERNRITLTSKEENKSYIESTLRSLRANSEEKLAELNATRLNLEERLRIKEAGYKNLEVLFKKAASESIDLSPLKAKHSKLASLKAKMENNRDRYVKDTDFFAANGTCPTCRQDIDKSFSKNMVDSNFQKISEINDGLNKIAEQINGVLVEIDHFEGVLRKINELGNDLSAATSEYVFARDSLQKIEDQIVNFAASDKTTQDSERQLETVILEISELQKEKETLLVERQYIDTAITLLKDGGIKTKIVKQYIPIINKHINNYLSKMGFFVNFNIDENFNESIKSRYRDEFSYNNFSEGEKLRIDLAILLTWRQIAKIKNSVNVNLIIFDEILDRALDTNGIDEFMKLMWNLDKSTNVFVISHKNEMVDRFEKNLTFAKVKNFSVLTKES